MTTNLHQKILSEFLNSNIKIKSLDRLNDYIAYCINNNQNEPIKGKSSHHHILPRADDCFPEYKDLKVNKWNGTYLMYSDHYYAHWLLTEAIHNSSQLFAFCAMHNKDLKLGRINESNLIPADDFQVKMEERSKQFSEWDKQYGDERKLKQSKTKQSKEWKDTIGKAAKTKLINTISIIQKNGKSLAQNRSEKAAETKKNTFIDGKSLSKIYSEYQQLIMKETNGYARASIKQKETKSSKEWKDTIGKQSTLKRIDIIKKNIKAGKVMYENSKGENHYATKVVYIYNNKNVLMYVSKGSLAKLINDNNLPQTLRNTLHNGRKLYDRNNNRGASKETIEKYKGWFMSYEKL